MIRKFRFGRLMTIALMLTLAASLSACSHAEAVTRAAPETTGSTDTPAKPASTTPMTREKASTECWMKYEKEGRGLSLDKRLPLVEKCTAEKMKGGR